MAVPLLGLSIVLVLSAGAGYSLLRWLRLQDAGPGGRLFLGMAAGLGIISTAMAVLGATQAYGLAGYGGALLLLLVAGIPGLPAVGSDLREGVHRARALVGSSRLGALLTGLIALHLLILLFAAWSPVYGYDALDRHLCVAKEYLLAGGFRPLTHIWGGDLPNQGVMLYVLCLALGDDRLAQVTNIWAQACTVLGVFALARPLQSPCLRLGSCLIVISLPTTTQYMASPYVDVYVLLWTLAAWTVLTIHPTRGGIASLLYAGLFGGLAAAVKLQGCIVFATLVPVAFLWLRLPGEPWRRSARRAAIFLGAGSIPVAFWLAKSAYLTGNPVYPFMYSLFGGMDWSVESELAQRAYVGAFVLPLSPVGFLRALWGYLFDTTIYMGNVIGPFFLFGLFVLVSPHLRRAIGWPALFGAVQVVTFFHLTTQIRYIYHAIPFLVVAAVGGFGYAMQRLHHQRLLLQVAAGLLYSVHLVYALALAGYVAPGVLGTEDRDTYLGRRVQYYDAYVYMNAALPADAGVLIPRSFGYYLDRSYLPWLQKDQGSIVHREMTDTQVLRRRLDSLKLTHVMEDRTYLYSGILKEFLRSEAVLVYDDPVNNVYALTRTERE